MTGPAFPRVRQGYDPASVDAYVSATTDRLAELAAEVARLTTQLHAVSDPDGILAAARAEAEVIAERARQELAWHRRRLRREQDLLDRQKQEIVRQIRSFSDLAVETAVRTG